MIGYVSIGLSLAHDGYDILYGVEEKIALAVITASEMQQYMEVTESRWGEWKDTDEEYREVATMMITNVLVKLKAYNIQVMEPSILRRWVQSAIEPGPGLGYDLPLVQVDAPQGFRFRA